jgi:hypothetical protein
MHAEFRRYQAYQGVYWESIRADTAFFVRFISPRDSISAWVAYPTDFERDLEMDRSSVNERFPLSNRELERMLNDHVPISVRREAERIHRRLNKENRYSIKARKGLIKIVGEL